MTGFPLTTLDTVTATLDEVRIRWAFAVEALEAEDDEIVTAAQPDQVSVSDDAGTSAFTTGGSADRSVRVQWQTVATTDDPAPIEGLHRVGAQAAALSG